MEPRNEKFALGWLPDFPDLRDYTEKTGGIKEVLEPTGVMKAKTLLPSSVDLGGGVPLLKIRKTSDPARRRRERGSLNIMNGKPLAAISRPRACSFIKLRGI